MLRIYLGTYPRNVGERNWVDRAQVGEKNFPGYTLNLEPYKCTTYFKKYFMLLYNFNSNVKSVGGRGETRWQLIL